MTEVTEHPDPAADSHDPAAGPRDPAAAPSEPSADDIGSTPPWWRRAGERVVRRPVAWARRDWPADRVVKVSFTAFALVCTTAIMMNVVHLNPLSPARDLVFDDTTPTGGDFGAHVWGPAFLRDNLIPSLRLNGWSMDWYAGMPAYRFYMVLPALAILVADIVLPYGVAMKLIGISGLITLPAACWAFGRLAAFRYPIPELFAFAGLAFALDESYTIYGGNLLSTMAGEFSFSLALSAGVLGLGLLANGLRTGRFRVWSAVLIAAAAVSHGIVAIFVLLAAFILVLVWLDRHRLVYAATVGVTAFLLSIWWVGPFLLNHAYMTDMKYGFRPQGTLEGRTDSFWLMFFPLTPPLNILITTFAVIGFAACVLRRHLTGTALGIIGLALVALVYVTRDSLPVIGLLWNPRLLPFLYFVRYLLMVIGILEVGTLIWNAISDRRARRPAGTGVATVVAGVTAAGVLGVIGFMYEVLPGGGYRPSPAGDSQVYAWGPLRATTTKEDARGDGWARYNFTGYEGRGSYYTEYYELVRTMERIGDDPDLGCGRALWENDPDNGRYGTTMALMLLPHWTDGCIGSMEGLFFEASGTTPYHFLAAAAMSEQSSNPVRELRYVDDDVDVGVPHLQDLGVRYVMLRSDSPKAQAAEHPDLSFITSSGPWDIHRVAESEVVTPLETRPVVVSERPGDPRERHLELGTSWFQQREEWAAVPAESGPDEWQRIDVAVDESRRIGADEPNGPRVDVVVPADPIEAVPLPPVTVSDVRIDQQSLSFSVDEVGVPVLVRVSYFPNWQASGADGPYRVAPNMMVVVPTDTTVEMTFGRSFIDWLFWVMALGGVVLCVYWRRRGDEAFPSEMPGPDVEHPDREYPDVEHPDVDRPESEREPTPSAPSAPDHDTG